MKNIIEIIANDYLESFLSLKFDICTCKTCKDKMLAYVLSNIPAKYVTNEKEALNTIVEQTKIENQAEIIKQIIEAVQIVSENPPHQIKENQEEIFSLLLEKIYQERGLDFRHYRRELLKRRFAVCMRAKGIKSYSEYMRLLINNPEEYDRLFEVLTINVSEFFRDPEVWRSLNKVLEGLIKEKKQNNDYSIRVWSAGCANGEEAYSIAILLKELIKGDNKFIIKIWGTDINDKCLIAAETGEYSKRSLNNLESKYLNKYFEVKDNYWRIKQEIRDLVKFRNLDLITGPILERMDLVLCRNVFIYLFRSLQEMLLTKLYKSILNQGYLVMGKVETILIEAKDIFKEIDYNAKIYQKK